MFRKKKKKTLTKDYSADVSIVQGFTIGGHTKDGASVLQTSIALLRDILNGNLAHNKTDKKTLRTCLARDDARDKLVDHYSAG